MSTSKVKHVVVSGEDIESEDEDFQQSTKNTHNVKVGSRKPKASSNSSNDKKKGNHNNQQIKVVTFGGEAPESDVEADAEEFGSTLSLASSMNSFEEATGIFRMDSEAAAVLAPILPQRTTRLDPGLVRKHRDRNKSLRLNISEKFLTPVIIQSAKKLDKLSQNLSNSQMQMQEALFQSRLVTGNMLKLQKELDNFLEMDYLKELKIQPTDEDTDNPTLTKNAKRIIENDNVEDLDSNNRFLENNSILNAALIGGLHLI